MITVLQRGTYRLIRTKTTTRILILDGEKTYLWNFTEAKGSLTYVSSFSLPFTTMSSGNYRLYKVVKEKNMTDGFHLELYVGRGMWNGYVLAHGLPRVLNQPKPILPTSQRISISSAAADPQASACYEQ